jgi:propanediol utilization protein
VLFGPETTRVLVDISQHGQYVNEQTVSIIGPEGARMDGVRVLGPVRHTSQVELSASEAYALGLDLPVRLSGDTVRTPGCILAGPEGTIELEEGAIIPARHLHLSTADADHFGLKQYDTVRLSSVERPQIVIDLVTVRVHPLFTLEFHLSTDEAAEFWLQTGDRVILST